jgi:hypothetical protein
LERANRRAASANNDDRIGIHGVFLLSGDETSIAFRAIEGCLSPQKR